MFVLRLALAIALAGSPVVALAAGLVGLWQPGGGTQWVRSGQTSDEFKAQDKIYFDQNLRIVSLAVRDGRFTTVWRPGTGAQWVHWGLTADEFKAKDALYFGQGLRIAALSWRGGQFAAVWRPGSGAQWVQWGLTGDAFRAQDATYFSQGMRITQLEADGGRLAVVWQPGAGTQWVKWGMTSGELESQDAAYNKQGLRFATMSVDGARYAAVWRSGTGEQYLSYRRCFTDFQTEDQAYFARGLRLNMLKLQDEATGAYHYPWKNGDSIAVAQGNNNASGSHNGSQAFAFDFSLPSDTQVRAAQFGTVQWLQQAQTASYDPTKATTPTNTPFPAGSLQNWGNAMRIVHLGGFTSWYFHLKPNSALVKVGDTVQAGQPIALSDNTGRTSGPHLHFQVQADSIDWGQSVQISFNNCQTPAGGVNVTSNNANPNFP